MSKNIPDKINIFLKKDGFPTETYLCIKDHKYTELFKKMMGEDIVQAAYVDANAYNNEMYSRECNIHDIVIEHRRIENVILLLITGKMISMYLSPNSDVYMNNEEWEEVKCL